MNIKYLYLNMLFAALAIGLVSCGDDSDDVEMMDTPGAELVCNVEELFSITQKTVASTIERDTSDAIFSYNDQNQLVAVSQTSSGEFCRTDGTCEPFGTSTFNVTFTYNDSGQWSSFQYESNGQVDANLRTEVIYENDRIATVKEDYIYDDGDNDFNETRFFYDEAGRLVKTEFWSNPAGSNIVERIDFEEYTYTGNNITKTVLKDADSNLLREITATFSTDINPFKDQYQINVAELLIDQLNTAQFLFSENTPTTFLITDFEENATVNGTVNYFFVEGLLEDVSLTETSVGSSINQFQLIGSLSPEVLCLNR